MPDADPNALAQALAMTQQSLAALQRMQEQTASLHRQFLESQEAAQRTLQTLVEQQQTLLLSGFGGGVPLPAPARFAPPPPAPAPLAAPRVAAPPAPVPTVVPPPAPPARPAVPPPPPKAAPRPAPQDDVATALLSVVSEKTGYPVESLDLSLSLDADLGVDSIKRVEILSALQERLPSAPQVRPEHLGSLHTLQDVANFLTGGGPAAAEAPADGDEMTRTMHISKDQLLLMTRPEGAPKAAAGAFADGLPSVVTTPAPRAASPDISGTLLSVVSEKTGYPVESLDLSLSLDADLGVDSIKRVEILSALQERLPSAPQVRPEHLGSLHTLQDVANFLTGTTAVIAPATTKIPMIPLEQLNKMPSASTTPVVPVDGVPAPSELATPDTEQVSGIRPPAVPESALNRKSGSDVVPRTDARVVPEGTIRTITGIGTSRVDRSILQALDLDLGTPRTRVPLATGGEIWVVGEAGPVTEAVAELLAGQGFAVKTLAWSGAAPTKSAGPLAGLVLVAPPAPGPESGLNRRALEWLKGAGPRLRQAGRAGGAVFVTVARLDGAFGLAELSADADPTAGGLAGLVKTARHEWPEVYCKAVDLSPAFSVSQAAAAAVVDEILSAGPTEVGIAPTHRCTLELARTVRRPGAQLINLGSKDVILVTGGARGVTAEVAVSLAETYLPTLVLTGRTPMPGAEPDWLAGLLTEPELKKAIADRLGADAGPRQVGEMYHKVVAQREVRRTLERVGNTGAKVVYFAVDITDGRAVADMLHQLQVKHGGVTAVVHGAGVLADRRIEDLTPEQFDTVYATKVDGLRNILDMVAQDELKTLVLFSSTTARFGRMGQAAYAVANEVLNKTAQVEARRRPGCRVVSMNWGPWDGGMVTPGLRKVFESEGVGLIPLMDGAVFLIQELSAAGKSVEVIALGKPRPGGGSGPVPVPAAVAGAGNTPPPSGVPVTGSVTGTGPPAPDMSLAFERSVDPTTHPVLKAHVLDGRAVLPMALHLEWLAHAALHGNPGLVFHGFNDLRVTSGVQIDSSGPVQVRAFAAKAVKQDKVFLVPVELRSRRKDGREAVSSRAEIVLVSALPPAPPADRPPAVSPVPYAVPHAYSELLFHGPELHGIDRIEGVSEGAFIATAFPAPAPADWFQFPPRSSWVADPLVLDSSFQMMILWTQSQHDSGSLPCFAGRYRQFRKAFPTDPTRVVIRVRRDDGKFARADIDYLDADGRVVAQLQDYECLMEKTLNQAFRRNQLARNP